MKNMNTLDVIRPKAGHMKSPLISQLRDSHPLMRFTAAIVLLCFTSVLYSPALHAAVQAYDQWREAAARDTGLADELQSFLLRLQTSIKQIDESVSTVQWQQHRQQLQQQREELDPLLERLNKTQQQEQIRLAETVQNERTRQRLLNQLQRQATDARLLQQGLDSVIEQEQPLIAARVLQQYDRILARLNPPAARHAYDNFTPFGPLDATARAPALTREALCTRLQLTAACESEALPVTADELDGPDLTITQAIRDQATQLGNDPVTIFNWVYNHIDFVPSYGSIQGADMTLQTKRGNAMDTASLLIALLRAAGTPARYQYGTVEMTKTDVKNWVGNVREDAAASNLLAQGGIPSAESVQNDRVIHYTLEHTWVQAWIGHQWVALDPGFKYHHSEPGLDLQTAVPFDTQTLIEQLQAGATINEAQGWVKNLDAQAVETQLEQYRTRLETYLATNHPDATVGEVIGRRTLIERTATTLPSQSSYQKVVASVAFSQIPDHLRHRFGFTLLDEYGNEQLDHTWYSSELAGKNLALSFIPAIRPTLADLLIFATEKPVMAHHSSTVRE